MRVLFDQGVPRGLAASLRVHEVTEARAMNWERISNGELLRLAEGAGFQLIVTTDKNVRYQQKLEGRKIAIVVLGNSPWWLVRRHLDEIVSAVNGAGPGSYTEVEIPPSDELRQNWGWVGGFMADVRANPMTRSLASRGF